MPTLQQSVFKYEVQDKLKILASNAYVEDKYCDSLGRMKRMEKGIQKSLVAELKKFERDVLVLLDNQNEQLKSTALGSVKCVACNQPTNSTAGPKSPSNLKKKAGPNMLVQANAPSQDHLCPNSKRPYMLIEQGGTVPVFGKDGQIYKGREESHVVFSPPTTDQNSSHYNIAYSANGVGSPSTLANFSSLAFTATSPTSFVPTTPANSKQLGDYLTSHSFPKVPQSHSPRQRATTSHVTSRKSMTERGERTATAVQNGSVSSRNDKDDLNSPHVDVQPGAQVLAEINHADSFVMNSLADNRTSSSSPSKSLPKLGKKKAKQDPAVIAWNIDQ